MDIDEAAAREFAQGLRAGKDVPRPGAQRRSANDPMVQAGHLAAEVHLWMVPKGLLA